MPDGVGEDQPGRYRRHLRRYHRDFGDGPLAVLQYVETVEDGEGAVQRVVFKLNPDHWDAPAGNVIEYMHLVRYKDHTAVKAALLDGSLDAVVGSGVLAPADVEEFRTR